MQIKSSCWVMALLAMMAPQVMASPWVTIHTNQGNIVVELDEDKAPASVNNFLGYVKNQFYNGTVFHRVIPNFMIQGGGYDTTLREKPTRPPIANESHNGLKNVRGSIAMARTSAPHSATSQFFINVADNAFLDRGTQDPNGYAVFGQVIQGMEVVDAISQQPTGAKGPFSQDVPRQTIIIERIELSESNPTAATQENAS